MKQKYNFGSFLIVVALLAASNLGLAQSFRSGLAAQDREPFAQINRRLNEAANAELAKVLPSAVAANRADSKTPIGSFSELLDLPAKLDEAPARLPFTKQSLTRFDLLRPLLESQLVRAGLPIELSGMVQVESGAQRFALSPRGARGLWQLMPATARRYGLTVTAQLDERLDAYKSTRAAASYLRSLYAQFGDWSLVFAAYNAGEQTIHRAIDRSGTTNFPELKGRLPTETRRYVPAVWASFAKFRDNKTMTSFGDLPTDRRALRIFFAETGPAFAAGHAVETRSTLGFGSVYVPDVY